MEKDIKDSNNKNNYEDIKFVYNIIKLIIQKKMQNVVQWNVTVKITMMI